MNRETAAIIGAVERRVSRGANGANQIDKSELPRAAKAKYEQLENSPRHLNALDAFKMRVNNIQVYVVVADGIRHTDAWVYDRNGGLIGHGRPQLPLPPGPPPHPPDWNDTPGPPPRPPGWRPH